jgi:hypothetical protein
MASNILDISILNPIKFREKGYVNPLPYNWNYQDDWNFEQTIPTFFEKKRYFQPWQKNDIIYLHFLSNYSPLQLTLYDCHGTQIDSFAMTYVSTSIEGSGQKAYEVSIALNGYAEGVYQLILTAGSPVIETLESEWFFIKALWPNSLKIEYKNNENDFDVAFETLIKFGFRILGGLTKFQPGADRTVFVDQTRNAVQLLGRSYYTYTLVIGDANGVPDWIIKRINEIFLCSTVTIDGRQFTANDGAKFAPVNDFGNPFTGWSIEIREADKRNSKQFVTDGNGNVSSSVVYQLENKGFGAMTGPAGSNVLQITNVD